MFARNTFYTPEMKTVMHFTKESSGVFDCRFLLIRFFDHLVPEGPGWSGLVVSPEQNSIGSSCHVPRTSGSDPASAGFMYHSLDFRSLHLKSSPFHHSACIIGSQPIICTVVTCLIMAKITS